MAQNQEVLRKAEKGLNDAVYHLTWAGLLWGRLGAIRLSRLRFEFLWQLNRHDIALSSLSSAYYTASGHAAARTAKAAGLTKLVWLVRAGVYLWQAMRLSDRLERMLGLVGMNPDQLDVRSRILFKARRYGASLRCSREALSRDGLSPDTQALLRFGMAETFEAIGESDRAALLYTELINELDLVRPTTSVRVLRSFGGYLLRRGDRAGSREVLERALAIAREHHLGDQITKIEVLLQ